MEAIASQRVAAKATVKKRFTASWASERTQTQPGSEKRNTTRCNNQRRDDVVAGQLTGTNSKNGERWAYHEIRHEKLEATLSVIRPFACVHSAQNRDVFKHRKISVGELVSYRLMRPEQVSETCSQGVILHLATTLLLILTD
ncbi:MAG: hypothetical protein Aurels2KO_32620 [Aureliella sp.]